MALNKTITANGSKGHHKFTLSVTEISTSGNSSFLNYTFTIAPIQSGWDWYGFNIPFSITIGANTYSGNISSYNGSSTVTLSSGSNIEVAHESDGTKTINVEFSVTDSTGQSYTCGNASASSTFTLSPLHKSPVINTATMVETNSVLTALSIPNTTIVRHLSKKTITLSATAYDSATLSYRLEHFATSYNIPSSGYQASNVFNTDYTQNDITIDSNNKASIIQKVLDSKGGSATDWLYVDIGGTSQKPNAIPYAKPTLIKTSTNIRRKSGNGTNLTDNKANINVVGAIYKGNDAVGNNNAIRTIGYKVWEKGTSEPANYTSFSTTPTPSSTGEVTITNYEISNIVFTKSYNYKIILQDSYSDGTNYYSDIAEGTIPLGQATWSEYADRVDFYEVTIKQNKVLSYLGQSIRVIMENTQTISRNTTTKINVDTVDYNTSTALTYSNNSVVIGKGVSSILVNCRYTAWGANSGGRYIYVYKNNNIVAFNNRAYSNTMETTIVIPVQENDYIEMYCYNEQSDTFTISNTDSQTFLQVTILG